METQEKLINGLYAAFPGESDTEIARRCGLSVARFSNYKLSKRAMDVDAVIGCAQALGWDIREIVAAHLAEKAESRREKGFWKEVGAMAVVGFSIAVGAFVYGQPEEWAIVKLILGHGGINEANQWLATLPLAAVAVDPVCIMRNVVARSSELHRTCFA